jgi:hypothetical protein
MTAQRPSTERFETWAKRRGLTPEPTKTGACARGVYRDLETEVDLEVEEYREANEGGRVSVTRNETALIRMKPDVDVHDLQVTPEGLAAKMSKLFGGQDIQLGDSSFDPEFLIRGRKPGVEKVLTPTARAALLHAHARELDVCIGEGVVSYRGVPAKDDSFLDSALEAVAEVAVALKA